ncbi:MAG: carboxylesterase family protein [Bacilli bacterium]|nr:carboxylesterase family protein [Bacilli bacterium]
MTKKQIQAEKERLLSSFGVNQELDSNPDQEHSVKCYNGIFVPKVKDDISIFRGIPFALPPKRWKKAEPVKESNKIFEAYYNGKTCIQTVLNSERASFYPQSEDCLYLNIWLNNKSNTKNKPIMVFIHGGSYGWGGTADPLYDGYNFVSLHQDVILITIAYRIGIFGFIDLSSLEGGEEYPDAPNLGLLDQIEALRWIKQNGEAFGGDINNITIFGESAGGGSVSLLPLIKEARGLFKRVIAESGSLALTYSKDECQILTQKLKDMTRVSNMKELASLPVEKLIEVNKTLNDLNNFPMRDGKLIPLDPYKAYLEEDIKDIDMIHGSNANEMFYWIGELGGLFAYSYGMPIKFRYDIAKLKDPDLDAVLNFMRSKDDVTVNKISEFYNEIMFRLPAIKQAEAHSSLGGNTFMYYWTVPSTIPYYKACHAVELAYVFNNPNETIYIGSKGDEKLARDISSMWVNFVKTGNPSIDDFKWEKYDKDNRSTLFINPKGFEMVKDPLKEQREMLDPILPYLINPGYGNIDTSMSFLKTIDSFNKALVNSVAIRMKK